MKNAMGLTVILVLIAASVTAQQPHYTVKPLVTINDGTFKDIPPVRKDGKVVSYVQVGTDLFDIDDDNTGSIKISGSALLCFEGAWKNGKKEGLFNVYVIDSLNHKHRYKIWEQQYKNDQLNGEWRNYTLRGTLYRLQTYENGNLKGIAREYDIDGKVMTQREFLGNEREYVDYYFYPNGKLRKTVTVRNGMLNGVGREFYENGQLTEEVNFNNDKFHGTRKYFYPNGHLWIEQVFKDGLDWEIVANYTEDGKRRDAGTLKNGNGTVIYYNEDGTVREVSTFVQGEQR